jgi:hypothetical protein
MGYLEKFKFLNEYEPSKGGEFLEETLVPANLRDLQIEAEKDEITREFLSTPVGELDPKYLYLMYPLPDGYQNETLINFIIRSVNQKNANGDIISFFCRENGKFNGFVGYTVKDNEVTSIKMFSFDPSYSGGRTLMINMKYLLDKLVKEYNKVSWFAVKENPVNRLYQTAIEKYGGYCREEGKKIIYCIEKNDTN